jgi:hypothetical protein
VPAFDEQDAKILEQRVASDVRVVAGRTGRVCLSLVLIFLALLTLLRHTQTIATNTTTKQKD